MCTNRRTLYAFYIFRFLTTKEKFHEFVDSEWQSLNGGNSTKDEKPVDSNETNVEEPDAKKAKLDHEDRNKDRKADGKRFRGQNKSRPHTKPTTYEEKRLCLSVFQVSETKRSFSKSAHTSGQQQLLLNLCRRTKSVLLERNVTFTTIYLTT